MSIIVTIFASKYNQVIVDQSVLLSMHHYRQGGFFHATDFRKAAHATGK